MRVVINAFSARLGGGQTYLKNLLTYIPSRDDLEILVFAPEDLVLPAHTKIRRVKTVWPTKNPFTRAIWERWVLPSFLIRNNVDVLFCPGGVVGTRVKMTCKIVTMFRNMIPFNASLVNSMPWDFQRLRNIILKRVLLKSMAKADLTIFISDHARAVIEALVNIPNPITIPHGISDSFRTANKNLVRPFIAPKEDYILYVSRFDIYKHHREVVLAFAALQGSYTKNLKLVFLGETDMPEAQPVMNLVRKLGLVDRVLMLGSVPYETLPAWYKHAQLILFASSCENCPNILLESMGSGQPVLSSNVMPMPEFGGENLIYFSPFDPKDIARSLSQILSDDECAKNTAEAAKLRSERYNWKLTAEKTWSQIFKLIEKEK